MKRLLLLGIIGLSGLELLAFGSFAHAQVGFPIEGELRGPLTTVDVIDGETLLMMIEGRQRDVLLNGIDAPEESASYLERLVEGKSVFLEFDVTNPYLYDPLPFAYAYVVDPAGDWEYQSRRYTQLNLELVKAGLADVLAIPPDIPYVELLYATLEIARDNQRGIWRDGTRIPRGNQLAQNPFYSRFLPEGELPIIDTFGTTSVDADANVAPAGEFDIREFAQSQGVNPDRRIPSLDEARTNTQDIVARLQTAQADYAAVPASSASMMNPDGTIDLAQAGARFNRVNTYNQNLANVQGLLGQMSISNLPTGSGAFLNAPMTPSFGQATTPQERVDLFSHMGESFANQMAQPQMMQGQMGQTQMMQGQMMQTAPSTINMLGTLGSAMISFVSNPSGAMVFVDGNPAGTTPLSLNMPMGSLVSYTVTDGQNMFRPVEGSVQVSGDETLSVTLANGVVTSNIQTSPALMAVANANRTSQRVNPFFTQPPQAQAPAQVISADAATFRYNPLGPDRNCSDFASQTEAQAFFEAAGGTNNDIHQLDRNGDGVVCTALP
jgi:micrococcal nuclease